VSDGFGDMWTGLYIAVARGDVAEVRRLVAAGADVDEAGPAGTSPLQMAVVTGQVEVIRVLVEMGANKDAKNASGWTPLHWAARNGRVEAVKALAECGANIGARADDGLTPLQLSLQEGHHHVARVLEELERTAARTQQAAAQSQSTAATATTTQAGACAACGTNSIPTDAAFKRCSRCKAVQYCSKDCQRTHWPVHKASCAAATATGSGGGASTTHVGGRAGTPAAGTLLQAAKDGDVAELRRLVAAGINVDEQNAVGMTGLHWAAGYGHVEAIRVLVELGANKDAKTVGGGTPLHGAVGAGHLEAVKVLAECGANIAARDADGLTPLQLSVQFGHHQVAEVLRQLERAARTQQAAETSERAHQAREAAERMAAELMEEEERKEAAAAQTKVCAAPPSPHIGLLSVQLGGERCGVSVARVSALPLNARCARGALQGKGKTNAGSGGAGGGPSTKAAAGSSGEASSSRGEATLPSGGAGLRSTVEDAVQPALPSVEGASGAQQTEPQPAGATKTKKEKERQRKERQRQRKIEEAMEALDGAMTLMEETAGARGVDAVEEAMQAASKHASRSEPLAALVVVARTMLEQARAAESERARVAAEAAAAAAAVKAAAEAERARVATEKAATAAAAKAAAELAAAAERQQLEERLAALTLGMQRDALEVQQVQAQLGVPPAAPQDEETLCVLCLDAPKDHIIIPCGHQCVCEACAEKLKEARHPLCPFCRTPIHSTFKVFVV
jgi:ankyrin repeat protein/uncharacterized protein YjgD (DUF1641 family)